MKSASMRMAVTCFVTSDPSDSLLWLFGGLLTVHQTVQSQITVQM